MKKILTILSSLMFWKASNKKREVIPYTDLPMDSLLIRVINPEEEQLHLALGITEERLEQIADLIEKALNTNAKDGKGIPGALEEVTGKLKHPNEIVYTGIIVGSWYEHNKRISMVTKMFGGGDKKD